MIETPVRLKKAYARTALRAYQAKVNVASWIRHHGLKLAILIALAALIISFLAAPPLQRMTGDFFADTSNLSALKSLLGGIGAALIGAAAIAFSLILFAMQVNVERMPHGLFKRLSSDGRLLGAFLGSFLIALVIAAASLMPGESWAVAMILLTVWGTIGILVLFLFAYRRALLLINPTEQLSLLSNATRRELKRWGRRAANATILIANQNQDTSSSEAEFLFNAPKAAFFQINSHWDQGARQAIQYANSYVRRFAEQGDFEVAEHAFRCIMLINAKYCATKHGTFIGSNLLFDSPGTTDGFINASLEDLRQTMRVALGKGDERLAEGTMRAMASLYGVYLKIEYSGHSPLKTHAGLAAGYLRSAVESVVAHNMPDVMMEGIRLMGRASRMALDHARSVEIVGFTEKIALLSYVGVLKQDHRPVTLTAFEQLADVTFDLLVKGKDDIRHAVRKLRADVTEAAKRFLETPDSALASIHSANLGPYFSSTSTTSFRAKLTLLVNQILEAPSDSEPALAVIRNIEAWADQLYIPQKELLLLSVQKRSALTFDIINWAVGISELLNALSNAPACSDHLRDKLRKHSLWLISTLSWLPDDKDSVTFAENYSVTESLFEAGFDGHQRDCIEFYEGCKGLLMSWARKGGRHETGWGIFETATKALVALTVTEGTIGSTTALKAKFREMLGGEGAPSTEVRARAAAELERSVNDFQRVGLSRSRIDHELAQQDQATMQTLMHEMTDILVPTPPSAATTQDHQER